MTRKPRKWNLPLSYEPKIEALRSGKCRQTIRVDIPEPNEFKYQVCDQVSFHGWKEKPYRSQWSWRTPYFELIRVINIHIYEYEMAAPSPWGMRLQYWDSEYCDKIAKLDYIDPPTGIELGNVLKSLNKIPPEGIKAQILRW